MTYGGSPGTLPTIRGLSMLKQLVLAGAVLTAAAPVGKAADVGAPPAYDWSGGYVGAHAGYGSADVD